MASATRARDIMTRQVIVVRRDAPVRDVIRTLLENRISGVPVVEDGRVVGIVSEGDLILRERALRPRTGMAYLAQQLFEDHAKLAEEYRKAHGLVAEDVMSRGVISCGPGTPVEEIANLMAEKHIKRVPVVEDERLVGLVARADVLRAAAQRLATLEARELEHHRSDDDIRSAILDSLSREPWAEVERLQLVVVDGTVTLEGKAESAQEREAIEVAARAIRGVRAVRNELIVDGRPSSE